MDLLTRPDSVSVLKCGSEDHCLELVVIEESVFFRANCICQTIDHMRIGNTEVMIDLRVSKLAAGLDEVLLLDLPSLLEI